MIRERKYYHGHIHLIRAKGLEPPEVQSLPLMMHINLWLVQFDAKNKEQYYRNVVSLGEELERNNGAYSLLDINRSSVILHT